MKEQEIILAIIKCHLCRLSMPEMPESAFSFQQNIIFGSFLICGISVTSAGKVVFWICIKRDSYFHLGAS